MKMCPIKNEQHTQGHSVEKYVNNMIKLVVEWNEPRDVIIGWSEESKEHVTFVCVCVILISITT